MLQVDLNARVRKSFGKSAARTLRSNGLTPAVLYGAKNDPLALEVETTPFTKALLGMHRQNAVINLAIADGKEKSKRYVMLKEIQTDPVKDTVVHADFFEVSLDQQITLAVPLKIKGKAKGVDMGGDLHVIEHMVALHGKVLDIPDFIEIDVTPLGLGDKITCGDLSVPGNVTLQEDLSKVCISVHHAVVVAEEAEEEGGEEEAPAPEGAEQEEG